MTRALLLAATLCMASCGDGDPGPPHECIGASLVVTDLDPSIDGIALAQFVEGVLPDLDCAYFNRLECIPAVSSCGFEDYLEATTREAEFRAAVAMFDPSLDPIDGEVVWDCYCRAYF